MHNHGSNILTTGNNVWVWAVDEKATSVRGITYLILQAGRA